MNSHTLTRGRVVYRWLQMIAVLLLPVSVLADRICEPTPDRTIGTHYQPVTRQAVDLGKGVMVRGRVLSARDCAPIPGARIERWQTNTGGVYMDRLFAWMSSGAAGRYRFETEWPGAPIPHIHFRVLSRGYKTLTTQWIGERAQDTIVFDLVLEPVP